MKIVAAGKAGGTAYNNLTASDRVKGTPPHVYVFDGLVRSVQEDEQADMQLREEAAQIIAVAKKMSDYGRLVSICKFSKCFDSKFVRLEIAMDYGLKPFLDHLLIFLEAQKSIVCYGGAPRNPLERHLQDLVSNMQDERST
jgi:hypothetical protein